MKIIYKIAKNEWRYLFYSPVAWFVMLVFLVECAWFFTAPMYSTANWLDILIKNDPHFKGFSGLTYNLFILGNIFVNAGSNLYLFIPILTMGLISREVGSGSVRLIYSSPVSLRQIVLGKFLGITIYNLLLVAILGIFLVAGALDIRHADVGMLLSALLGFYLLVCAYSSIGLFMSSLSNYQIVSAMGSFVVIFILSRIGDLWQRYDFVRDLTWFLSLQSRTLMMLRGLVITRDVIYFILVTAMFVAFTWIKLQAGRENRPWYIRLGRYATVLALVLLAGYITSRPKLTGYLDATEAKFNTLPVELQDMLRNFGDSTLEVTLYTNLLGKGAERGMPESRNSDYMAGLWDPYLRFRPDIVFKYVYYYDIDTYGPDSALYQAYKGENLKKLAAQYADATDADLSMFQSPAQIHRQIDLRPEAYRLVMQLKYKGRTTFLRTFDDPDFWPDKKNIAGAFKRLLYPDSIPHVYYLTGDLERDIIKTGDREYAFHSAGKYNRGSLVNTGFDVDTLNMSVMDMPARADLLVLADPRRELSSPAQDKLKNYMRNGGNMLITGEPGKQAVLNPLLKDLGLQLMYGQLIEPSWDETPDKVVPWLTAAADQLYPDLRRTGSGLENRDTTKILMPGVAAIAYSRDSLFTVQPLLRTISGKTWLRTGAVVTDSTLAPFDPAAGDFRQPDFATAVLLTRQLPKKEQRIILSGDADFASNNRASINWDLIIPMYSWLAENRFPVWMPNPQFKDKFLRITAAGANAQTIAFVYVLPALLLLAGVILLIRRKRK